jgi:hypothetical protein
MDAGTGRRPFTARLRGALVLDATVYAEVEHDPPALLQAAVVVTGAGVARGLVALATDDPFGITASLAIAWVSWAIVTALLWLVGVVFDHDTSTFFELLRTVGFAAAPLLLLVLAAIPFLAAPPVVLALKAATHVAAGVALVVAAREALDVSTARSIAICGSVLLALGLALAYVINAVALRLQGVIDVVVSAAART